MTLDTLRAVGVTAEHRVGPDGGHSWTVSRGAIRPSRVVVEPDLSNAGPFLAAAVATGGTVAVADWPELTTQPGDAYRDLLSRMGAKVWREGETVCVRGGGAIHGIDVHMSAPGEPVATISATAAVADSPPRLRGVGHLRGDANAHVQAAWTT